MALAPRSAWLAASARSASAGIALVGGLKVFGIVHPPVHELGGGGFPSLTRDNDAPPPYARLGEVETVDGFVLCLSPWVVRNVRFHEGLGSLLHGYDFNFRLELLRDAGRKVVTADFKVIHNHSLELRSDLDHWIEAHVAVADKWDGRMPGPVLATQDWKYRARRAGGQSGRDARQRVLDSRPRSRPPGSATARSLPSSKGSLSWRVTAPLRHLRYLQRRRTGPGAARATQRDPRGRTRGQVGSFGRRIG